MSQHTLSFLTFSGHTFLSEQFATLSQYPDHKEVEPVATYPRASSVPIFPIFPIFFNFPYIFLFNSKTPYNPYNVRLKRQKSILAESCKTDSAQLAFVLSMELKFLCFFQSEGPLINLLHYEMCKLLKLLMDCFLKETEGNHLLTVEYSKSDNLLSNSQIEVGENTRSALSKLTTDQQKVALTGMNQFYVETTK